MFTRELKLSVFVVPACSRLLFLAETHSRIPKGIRSLISLRAKTEKKIYFL